MNDLEQRILAILRNGEVSTLDIWRQLGGDTLPMGAVWVTLWDLEAREVITYRTEPGGPERGGRPKRYYRVRG